MSELRVDSVKSKGGGAPDLPKGVTISGIATAATLGATTVDVSNVNVSGVVTSGTLNGPLLSTGTPTLGLGVTINSSGVAISGVATAGIVSATTLYGDGSNLTGVGASIVPLFYQPDPYDTGVLLDAGIGITFNQQVKAGTGNVTLSIANAGVAGTVVENFGVGSSVSISENRITIDPTADISATQVYHISYPSGCFTNNEGTDYVGTGYTFEGRQLFGYLWGRGDNRNGDLAQNNTSNGYSSAVQIPGSNWNIVQGLGQGSMNGALATKKDNTLWGWGKNDKAQLAQNNKTSYSSPVQIPGTNWSSSFDGSYWNSIAVKTDGTLWAWGGDSTKGANGQNDTVRHSSPVQIPGTTWSTVENSVSAAEDACYAIRTDGTLWSWGLNESGMLGQNAPETSHLSSPTQIPGTTWSKVFGGRVNAGAIRTDGTLWMWGRNTKGGLGDNSVVLKSSPVQVPGTTWKKVACGSYGTVAVKTDGTLWTWGWGNYGALGQNDRADSSSPVQIDGTDWNDVAMGNGNGFGSKTDGTMYAWGRRDYGVIGSVGATATYCSSPTQIPGTNWDKISAGYFAIYGIDEA